MGWNCEDMPHMLCIFFQCNILFTLNATVLTPPPLSPYSMSIHTLCAFWLSLSRMQFTADVILFTKCVVMWPSRNSWQERIETPGHWLTINCLHWMSYCRGTINKNRLTKFDMQHCALKWKTQFTTKRERSFNSYYNNTQCTALLKMKSLFRLLWTIKSISNRPMRH